MPLKCPRRSSIPVIMTMSWDSGNPARSVSVSDLRNASAVALVGQSEARPQPGDLLAGVRPVRQLILSRKHPDTLKTHDELSRHGTM